MITITPINDSVCKTIKDLRKNAGLTQHELGVLCGWPQQRQSQIEGGNQQISVEDLQILAGVLGVEVVELLPGPPQKEGSPPRKGRGQRKG